MYQASTGPEMIPIEIDIDRVRSSRDRGVLRLGQTLKSFRDHKTIFDIYDKDKSLPYLDSLGPLLKPTQVSRTANLEVLEEHPAEEEDK